MYAPLQVKKVDNQTKIASPASLYQPSKQVKEITGLVARDWQQGIEIQRSVRPEFNDRSLISEIDTNQKAFNSYVPPRSEDPDESWRAQTVRPITRNKLISIAAHVTATMLYPGVFAQNRKDEEDRAAAQVMADLVEWAIDNSAYARSFVQAVIGALVDPAVILSLDYAHVMRTVKELKADGTWEKKQVLDEILSGFQVMVVPCKEILIANFYEPDIQRQRFVIRNKYVDHSEAQIVYGGNNNFKYVRPGVRAVFDDQTSTFYDVVDEDMKGTMVNEVTYYNRALDLELCFLNGILMNDPDQPMRRQDKLYPFSKSGFEPLGNGQCFYYKSAANKLGSDQEVVDTLYNMVIDGSFLALMPPMALYGSEDINSSVTIPGSITSFRDPNTKLENIGPRSDIRAGLEVIGTVERSIAESSQDNSRSGVDQGGDRTAREVILLDKNAQIALGLFGKSVRFLVEDFGNLLIGTILQHMTVGEATQITDPLQFRTFLLPDKIANGRKVTKEIKFVNPEDYSEAGTPEEELSESFKIMKAEGGLEATKQIALVNPALFRTRRYKARVSADEFNRPSKALEKALNLEAYDRLITDPNVDQRAVTQEFLLDVYRPGESEKFMRKEMPTPMPGMGAEGAGGPVASGNRGTNTSMLSQITGSNSLGVAASSE